MKKLLSYRGLMGFIYALVMLLPFSAIALRCVYVTFNKNAYQSYYGKTINEVIPVETIITDLESGKEYNAKIETQSNRQGNITIYSDTNLIVNNVEKEGYTWFAVFQSTNTLLGLYGQNVTTEYLSLTSASYTIEFTFNSYNAINNSDAIIDFSYNTYNKYSYLDNAFDYSLQSFIDENGVGRLNLTNWFVDIFLDNTTHNMLYINYINWYMNYSLLVSCVYLLYLVLMWFITLARRLLTSFDEKGSLSS